MVGTDAELPLPWLAPLLERTLATRHAHALLLQGPQGVGQFDFATTLAQAWLCEAAPAARRPCGRCPSCHLVQARAHPDLLVLLPEALQETLGWAGAHTESDRASKAKPSKLILVDAVRTAIAFAQSTSARGRSKVAVLHPAEHMNAVAANTLLKTLEEPPGGTRFLLCCAAPDALLPTIRSRCQVVPMALPPEAQAVAWLEGHGVADAAVLLAGAGGQPQEALDWSQQGVDAASWRRFPALVAAGAAAGFEKWPLGRLVDALQKLCHDAACLASGAAPRYFPAAALPPPARLPALLAWRAELDRVARHAEHPWSLGLMVEALVEQGRQALSTGSAAKGPRARADSLHSRS
ncbi:MAG: DNA polymerase III subunit delta' [Pseudomonadota bacterium]|nr:DNA polymerase III subunit delta' [Pseudomonadota bacterium]